jgi:hypothetical protein
LVEVIKSEPETKRVTVTVIKGGGEMTHLAEHILEMHLRVEDTAEWRRRLAVDFPKDKSRNEAAAKDLETIANEIRALDGSPILNQIDEAWETFQNLNSNDQFEAELHRLFEAVSEKLRDIGFRDCHSGLSLLEWYRDLLQETIEACLDERVPIPDLDEQVENDPIVKAAREAYEQTKAKALAQARKRR